MNDLDCRDETRRQVIRDQRHNGVDYLVMERQTLATNPVKPSHLLRQGRPLPKKLSQDQVRTLRSQELDSPPWRERRTRLRASHSTGRKGEPMKLDQHDDSQPDLRLSHWSR